MTTTWRNGHFLAPSVERFFDQLTEDVSEGRSLVVVVPNSAHPNELRSAIKERLERRGIENLILRLTEVPDMTKPVQALANQLQVEWQPAKIARTAENLLRLRIAQYPDEQTVVFLEGFDELEVDARQSWLELLTLWSNMTHAIANTMVPTTSLCLIAQADGLLSCLPNSMLYLKIRWWWGVPSRIEVQLYCHSLSEAGDAMEETLWREYLLPHLVGDDVTLLKYLWDKLFGAPTELLSSLANYAESRWPDHQVAEWRLASQSWHESRFVQPAQLEPPFEARNLWANGIVTSSVEHGIELHPAIAALLGYHQAIYHRLWRGQASLLLPLLDQTRLTLCSYLTRRYGPDWPLRWDAPLTKGEEELLHENPLACEWGHLHYLLENCGGLKGERRYASLAKQGRDLRNRLAHYRPVSYASFRTFWQEQAVLVARA